MSSPQQRICVHKPCIVETDDHGVHNTHCNVCITLPNNVNPDSLRTRMNECTSVKVTSNRANFETHVM